MSTYRLYGTRQLNGKPFDVYARSAISACMPPPGDDLTAMKVRGEALRLWRRVSKDQKKVWRALYEARHSDPRVYRKGLRLLETQGLLAELEANCQRIIHARDAGPSRPAPALPEPATTSTLSFGGATSTQTTLDQYSPSPMPAISENISVKHWSPKSTACTAGTPDRTSPPEASTILEHMSAVDRVSTNAVLTKSKSHPRWPPPFPR